MSAPVQQLLDCMISTWYPQFQNVTFRTVILPLSQPVVNWLVSDGLHVPDVAQAFAKRGPMDEYALEDEYREWTSEDEEEQASHGSPAPPPPPELAELRAQLDAAIEMLGGRVVPKLSWSAPKDAIWMSPSASLGCINADEVLLLLRSSDRVAHDICHALPAAAAAAAEGSRAHTAAVAAATKAAGSASEAAQTQRSHACIASADGSNGEAAAAAAAHVDATAVSTPAAPPPAVQHCLALRRWYDLQPGREFRCFVVERRLVGASQRDVTHCYDFLREERAELAALIQAFHAKHIDGRFPHPTYTYDVYVATSGAVRLVDFNPASGTTAPLLFSWEELLPVGDTQEEEAPTAASQHADVPCPATQSLQFDAAAASPQSEDEKPAGQQVQHVSGHQAAVVAGERERGSPAGHDGAAAGQCQACCGQQTDSEGGGQQGGGEQAAGAEPSYLEQLRRLRALSLSDSQQQQQQQQLNASEDAALLQAGRTAAPTPTAGAAGSPAVGQFELRIVEEAVAMRPNTMAYGVPYDFVDGSEGSALERLMAQQAQQGGASELWQALAAQAGGASAEAAN